jgi:3-oxoacyl-[acyl-carrier-protein] synthase-3
MVDTTDEWIVTRTGIRERRIAADHEAASDLGSVAARRALERANLSPSDLDLIVVASVTPDMPFPATASIIQHALGADRAAAFDLSAGCTGFIYAVSMASATIASGAYNNVLVIGVDLLSKITNWSDRSTCVLFGDGAGAAVLGVGNEQSRILAFELGSVGEGADLLRIPAGGSRKPITVEAVQAGEQYIQMCGSEVFKFAVRIIVQATQSVLAKAGLTTADIDAFVAHQANIRIIESATKRLELPDEKVIINVDRYGNTSAASIPLALDEAERDGRIKRGDVVLMVGFGAGLSWGATVLRW